MARFKNYVETDVLVEARKRLHHIFDMHDNVVVSFSGGKDSLAVLHLTRQVAAERGIDKVHAVFRDEEIISQEIIDFVSAHRNLDWLDLRWFCVPLKSTRLVLGSVSEVIQWDPRREWVRGMPKWGLREADLGLEPGTVVSQYTADELTVAPFKGKVCILTGVRASESIMRWQACVNKLNDNYIVASSSKRATLGRPIFDWEEADVFRYFYDEQIPYCPIYDSQGWAGAELRVSSGLNVQTSKFLHRTKTYDPDLYERICEVFPETATQERYHREFDSAGMKETYGSSMEGVRAWIEEFITEPKQRAVALREFAAVSTRRRGSPDMYPTQHVLGAFMTQGGSRTILPLKTKASAKA